MQFGRTCPVVLATLTNWKGQNVDFDTTRQLVSQTIALFEQELLTIFREAWPTADIETKEYDSMLQCCFVDGCFDPALQQFLRLHARNDDFETSVGKARQYMDAQEQAKVSAVAKKNKCVFWY